jgi:uncharacterized iron-regulated membrane protein
MSLITRAKRVTYLIHRYTGVAACVFMALWFVSGITMLFIGYPKLSPAERLGALPALSSAQCCIALDTVLAPYNNDTVTEITLTTIAGTPHFRVKTKDGTLRTVNATTGNVAAPVDAHRAQHSASAFIHNTQPTLRGIITEDHWTHSRGLDVHRPLFLFAMHDIDNTWLYVSSVTGEVVMDASGTQRLWNYVGAWLHWLYMFRDTSTDPVWSWIVIIISAIGVVTAIAGTFVGIWRWRFSGKYKSGSKSPYQQTYWRWHHITGLLFSAIVFTWILSGLFSMNPLGMFNAKQLKPDHVAYRGSTPDVTHLALSAHDALVLLEQHGFTARELSWRTLDSRPYLLAKDGRNHARIIIQQQNHYTVLEQWPQATLEQAAVHLLPAAITSVETITQDDAYYYTRHPESMLGANERRLPALKLHYDDPGNTLVYLDMYTGDVVQSLDRTQRTGRWLFNFLHSWDLPVMLKSPLARDVILILLSLGGLALSVTGVVIGVQRIRLWLGKLKR